jgi:ADP-ribose pyrophosphatase
VPLPLFAFGTLRDSDVLEVVLERSALELERIPARLRGYRVARLPDESYPVLVESRGDSADGMLIRGLSEKDFHRIAFFENSEYELEHVRVELSDAREVEAVYCSEGVTKSGAEKPWFLDEWQHSEKPRFIEDVRRYMQLYGKLNAEEADSEWIKWKCR